MKDIKYQGEEEIIKKGINVLLKKLGPVETTRFLNIPRKKRFESVKRHRDWQKSLNKDNFIKELFSE
jgi:bifunctional DNA-binding transcriptional regulator/antitoxin component of YhaV-PrlF toxin-antitoxin module